MRVGRAGWLAGLLVLAGAHARAAELHVECASIGEAELAQALEAELADHPAARAGGLRVRVSCVDPDRVEVVVERAGARRARQLDVRDVPVSLRARMIALVAAESVALVMTVAEAPPAEAPPVETPPVETPPVETPPPRRVAPSLPAAATLSRPAPARTHLAIVPALGVRAYGPRFRIVPVVAADAGWGRWSFGASIFTSLSGAATGQVRLNLIAAGAEVRIGCVDAASLEVCVAPRAEAGVVWADAQATQPGVLERDQAAAYVSLAARGLLGVPAAGARLYLDLGWSEGLIASADGDEAARAAGLYLGFGVGVRLW